MMGIHPVVLFLTLLHGAVGTYNRPVTSWSSWSGFKPYSQSDIVFAIDDSASIGPQNNFNTMIKFCEDIVNSFFIVGKWGTQFGAVSFSNHVTNQFHLNRHNRREDVIEDMKDTPYLRGGSTRMGDALQYIRTVSFLNQNRNIPPRYRPAKIVVLLTDGKSNKGTDVVEEAAKLRAAGIIVICIGIGNSVDYNQLRQIAYRPGLVFRTSFAELTRLVRIVRIIVYRSCFIGIPGRPGRPGIPGKPGRPGPPGSKGPTGDQGTDGKRGPPGNRGKPGPQGRPGDQGNPGLPGDKGNDGRRGPQGPPGQKGPDGPRGPPGSPGKDGTPGDPGNNGADGGPGAPGAKGDKGQPGQKGVRGHKGVPGPPGDRGTKGPYGAPGKQGPPGDKGDKGPPGKKGPRPEKGEKGERGPPGPPGDKGESGYSGTLYVAINDKGYFSIVKGYNAFYNKIQTYHLHPKPSYG